MITTKNKEEIEKILKEMPDICDIESGIHKGHWTYDDVKFAESKARLQERIKTSIEWCEDEIKRIRAVLNTIKDMVDFINIKYKDDKNEERAIGRLMNLHDALELNIGLSELQTHLKWLKEQEIKC